MGRLTRIEETGSVGSRKGSRKALGAADGLQRGVTMKKWFTYALAARDNCSKHRIDYIQPKSVRDRALQQPCIVCFD